MSMQGLHWSQAAFECQQTNTAYALATVIATSGSTPRDNGSKMVITATDSFNSLGGGGLEHLVITRARELLDSSLNCQELKQFPLAAAAQQCCGGSMTILLECFAAKLPDVVIFGAGHVTHALLKILSELPIAITLIDSRAELLAPLRNYANLNIIETQQPQDSIAGLPSNAHVFVLTHDHKLDYSLTQLLLEEYRWGFLGLIGSKTKANRFKIRLRNDGISEHNLNLLQCPIGNPAVKSKLPMEVAISLSNELLLQIQSSQENKPTQNWRDMKALLAPPKSSVGAF